VGHGSIWLPEEPLLLASTSNARRVLLEAAGLPVETEASGIDERAVEASMAGAPPALVAQRLAHEKAVAVAVRHPTRVVVGADQVLELDGRSFSKPGSLAEAAGQISELAGRSHHLHSAVALRVPGRPDADFVEQASLTMRHLDRDAIGAYLERVGPAALWSPGSYQVEGLGIHLFEHIEGEHTTILGLPMLPLLAAFRRFNLIRI
jgi:septum formation protein